MKYWSNKVSAFVDINDYPHRLDGIFYTSLEDMELTYCIEEYDIKAMLSAKIKLGELHIITVMPFSMNVKLNDTIEIGTSNKCILLKTYIIFDSESDKMKWKLKI